MKIVSGGQTGADRGALLAALDQGAPCGGWCPAGRRAEDGAVPAVFPVTELPAGGYGERTRRNVLDSDGTVIIYCRQLGGGSLLTRTEADAAGRPRLVIDAADTSPAAAAAEVVAFVEVHGVQTLNVAGPRASEWPQAESWVRSAVGQALRALL